MLRMVVQPATGALYDAADVTVGPYAARHARLGGQARARALRLWSPDVVVPQYLEVYRGVIDSQAPPVSG